METMNIVARLIATEMSEGTYDPLSRNSDSESDSEENRISSDEQEACKSCESGEDASRTKGCKTDSGGFKFKTKSRKRRSDIHESESNSSIDNNSICDKEKVTGSPSDASTSSSSNDKYELANQMSCSADLDSDSLNFLQSFMNKCPKTMHNVTDVSENDKIVKSNGNATHSSSDSTTDSEDVIFSLASELKKHSDSTIARISSSCSSDDVKFTNSENFFTESSGSSSLNVTDDEKRHTVVRIKVTDTDGNELLLTKSNSDLTDTLKDESTIKYTDQSDDVDVYPAPDSESDQYLSSEDIDWSGPSHDATEEMLIAQTSKSNTQNQEITNVQQAPPQQRQWQTWENTQPQTVYPAQGQYMYDPYSQQVYNYTQPTYTYQQQMFYQPVQGMPPEQVRNDDMTAYYQNTAFQTQSQHTYNVDVQNFQPKSMENSESSSGDGPMDEETQKVTTADNKEECIAEVGATCVNGHLNTMVKESDGQILNYDNQEDTCEIKATGHESVIVDSEQRRIQGPDQSANLQDRVDQAIASCDYQNISQVDMTSYGYGPHYVQYQQPGFRQQIPYNYASFSTASMDEQQQSTESFQNQASATTGIQSQSAPDICLERSTDENTSYVPQNVPIQPTRPPVDIVYNGMHYYYPICVPQIPPMQQHVTFPTPDIMQRPPPTIPAFQAGLAGSLYHGFKTQEQPQMESQQFKYPSMYVSESGLITVLLRLGVSIEMTTDQVVRMVSHNKKLVALTNSRGTVSYLFHPAARIVQELTTTEADIFLGRKVKMTTENVLFANNFKCFKFDNKDIEEAERVFSNQIQDKSTDYLFKVDGNLPMDEDKIAKDSMRMIAEARYDNFDNGGFSIKINNVKIVQTPRGDVTVTCGPKFMKMLPHTSAMQIQTHFVDIGVAANWSIQVRRGDHTLNASHCGMVVSNGKIDAGFDQGNRPFAFQLPQRIPLLPRRPRRRNNGNNYRSGWRY